MIPITHNERLIVLLELLYASAGASVVPHRHTQSPLVHRLAAWNSRVGRYVLIFFIKSGNDEGLRNQPATEVHAWRKT